MFYISLFQDEWNIFMMTKTRSMILEMKEDAENYSEEIKDGTRVGSFMSSAETISVDVNHQPSLSTLFFIQW